jgi:hypothetical protein
MFIENKYTKWYYSIINNRMNNPHEKTAYTEKHHIIPKSFDGSNERKNLVRLSAREHFLVHWLLTKMRETKDHTIKMNHALLRLMSASETLALHKWSKWQYEVAKNKKSLALKEARNIGKDPRLGKKHSLAAKEKMRRAKLGVKRRPEVCEYLKTRPVTDETRRKISKALTGRIFSEESRKKSSVTQKGKPQNKSVIVCFKCGHENYATQIKRYHNDNCKLAG